MNILRRHRKTNDSVLIIPGADICPKERSSPAPRENAPEQASACQRHGARTESSDTETKHQRHRAEVRSDRETQIKHEPPSCRHQRFHTARLQQHRPRRRRDGYRYTHSTYIIDTSVSQAACRRPLPASGTMRRSSRSTPTLALTTSIARARATCKFAACTSTSQMRSADAVSLCLHTASCSRARHAPKPRSVRRTLGSSGPKGCHPQLQDPGGQSPTDPMIATLCRRLPLTQKVDNMSSTLQGYQEAAITAQVFGHASDDRNSMFAKLTLVDRGINKCITPYTARSATDAGHLLTESKAKRPENRQQGFASLHDNRDRRAIAGGYAFRAGMMNWARG